MDNDRFLAGNYRRGMAIRIGAKKPIKLYLEEWRQHRELTQEQVAARMDTTKTTVSRHETGERASDEGYLAAYAEAVGCHPSDLYRDPKQASADELLRSMSPEMRAQAIRLIAALKTAS